VAVIGEYEVDCGYVLAMNELLIDQHIYIDTGAVKEITEVLSGKCC